MMDGSPGYIETGSWTLSSSTGYNGSTYHYTLGVSGTSTASATWTPDIPTARLYEVYAAYRSSSNRATNVQVTINHSSGTNIVYLNQNGENEVVESFLGEFYFEAGTTGFVRFDNNGTSDNIIADAVIWREVVDPVPEISNLSHLPELATSTDTVTVTANITDNGTVSAATLSYWVSPSGTTGTVTAYDDGAHGDEAAGRWYFRRNYSRAAQ